MDDLWFFLTGNLIDAVLFMICAIFLLLCVGSFLAAWFSLRDETQYAYRRHKVDVDVDFSGWLIFRHWDSPEVQAFRKKAEQTIVNLLILKHIAIRQTLKYGKYVLFYAGLLAASLGVQSWHMNAEIRDHELSAEQLRDVLDEESPPDGVQVKSHEDGVATVIVEDKERSASYEFAYAKDGEGWQKKYNGQKVLKIPEALQNLCAVLWLLLLWGLRYLHKSI